jgi:hypothetical protein
MIFDQSIKQASPSKKKKKKRRCAKKDRNTEKGTCDTWKSKEKKGTKVIASLLSCIGTWSKTLSSPPRLTYSHLGRFFPRV